MDNLGIIGSKASFSILNAGFNTESDSLTSYKRLRQGGESRTNLETNLFKKTLYSALEEIKSGA